MIGEAPELRKPDAITVERHHVLEPIGVTGDAQLDRLTWLQRTLVDSDALASAGALRAVWTLVLCAEDTRLAHGRMRRASSPASYGFGDRRDHAAS
jgi:hypothetical protein